MAGPARMRRNAHIDVDTAPETRSELHQWIRKRLHLSAGHEQALLDAIDHVFIRHERLWQQSKQEAIQAVSAGFTERLNKLREELSAREATVSSIARFGGDEFCFLIPDLDHFSAAWIIAERFREAVERYDWMAEDPRLAEKPVNVDVGVVCLLLGPVGERRTSRRFQRVNIEFRRACEWPAVQ